MFNKQAIYSATLLSVLLSSALGASVNRRKPHDSAGIFLPPLEDVPNMDSLCASAPCPTSPALPDRTTLFTAASASQTSPADGVFDDDNEDDLDLPPGFTSGKAIAVASSSLRSSATLNVVNADIAPDGYQRP